MRSLKLLAFACASALSTAALAAPDDVKVCDVVPVSDFESALAIKVTQTRVGEGECERFAGRPGISSQVKAQKRQDQKASGTAFAAQMKRMGFKVEVLDDAPELWCAMLTPPATLGNAQVFECRAVTQGHYIEVKAMGPNMTREKAKSLVARVSARLP